MPAQQSNSARKKKAKRALPPDINLTALQILNADDRKAVRVPCPEWGGYVHVRPLTGLDRDQVEVAAIALRSDDPAEARRSLRAEVCRRAVCDASGEPLFTEAHLEALGEKSAAPLDRIFDVVRALSGMSDGDVEELVGNSDSGPSGDSG